MNNPEIENLINIALVDGELTEKEKQILFKKAESAGIDLDEFEMLLNARVFEKQQELNRSTPATAAAAPKSDKFGDIKKCPACGGMLQSFQTKCDDCGHEFRNIDAVGSAQKLFDLLQAATIRNSQGISDLEKQKAQRLDALSQKHNSDGTLVKLFAGKSRAETQDEEREDLIREINKDREKVEKSLFQEKANIIKNFPIPNTKEDLIELLAMATSNAYDNDGNVGHEEEVWIQKTDQIYSKIKIAAEKDPAFLDQATNMVVSLMKKLPSKYKKFTTFPEKLKDKIAAELENDKKRNWENKVNVSKPYLIAAGVLLLTLIISSAAGIGLLLFISVVGLAVTVYLLIKALNKLNDSPF
jgi:hypothetical protein